MCTNLTYNKKLLTTHAYNIITTCAYKILPLLVQWYQLMSKAKHWGGRLVHSECLGSEISFTPEGTSPVGGSSVIAFGTKMQGWSHNSSCGQVECVAVCHHC